MLWKNKSIWTNKIKCRVISKKSWSLWTRQTNVRVKLVYFLPSSSLTMSKMSFVGSFSGEMLLDTSTSAMVFNFLAKFALKIWLTNTKKCKKLWKKKLFQFLTRFMDLILTTYIDLWCRFTCALFAYNSFLIKLYLTLKIEI